MKIGITSILTNYNMYKSILLNLKIHIMYKMYTCI